MSSSTISTYCPAAADVPAEEDEAEVVPEDADEEAAELPSAPVELICTLAFAFRLVVEAGCCVVVVLVRVALLVVVVTSFAVSLLLLLFANLKSHATNFCNTIVPIPNAATVNILLEISSSVLLMR